MTATVYWIALMAACFIGAGLWAWHITWAEHRHDTRQPRSGERA